MLYFFDILFFCRMIFIIEVDIGGFFIMEYWENYVNEIYNLIGIIKILEYVFCWDFVFFYYCVEKEIYIENCVDLLIVLDLIE